MKVDPDMKQRERDVRMMESPLEWPRLLLPLKKINFKLGFMAGNGPRVYEGSIYDQALMQRIRDGVEKGKEYPSFGAIYDDGWRVD